jgi:adenosylcobinamide-GDP ribazoletransferase
VRAALAFLTPLPVGAARPDTRTLRWLPVAGAVIGLVVGGSWWAAAEVLPVLVAAAVVVLVDVAVTGALHLDGLADSADGLLGHLDGPDRRRAVMAAPDVGAFGAVAVGTVLLLRFSAFASVVPDVAVVVALWSASRGAMAVALVTVPYVGGGLGAAFLGGSRLPVLVASGAVPLAVALLADEPAVAVAAVVAAGLAGAVVVAAARRRLGGITGDVLGAAGVVAETVGLVVAVARW